MPLELVTKITQYWYQKSGRIHPVGTLFWACLAILDDHVEPHQQRELMDSGEVRTRFWPPWVHTLLGCTSGYNDRSRLLKPIEDLHPKKNSDGPKI